MHSFSGALFTPHGHCSGYSSLSSGHRRMLHVSPMLARVYSIPVTHESPTVGFGTRTGVPGEWPDRIVLSITIRIDSQGWIRARQAANDVGEPDVRNAEEWRDWHALRRGEVNISTDSPRGATIFGFRYLDSWRFAS
jgi:hypothetical protein